MGQVGNSQSFNAGSSSSLVNNLVTSFKTNIDTLLQGGRDITIHLPAAQSPCPSGCKYNSAYGRFVGSNGGLCTSCGGKGFVFEPRWTVYKANIKWTDEGIFENRSGGEDTPAGKVYETLARTKTVVESLDHINQSLGATIDGFQCELWGEPRTTGFGDSTLYVVSFWKKVNKKLSNG